MKANTLKALPANPHLYEGEQLVRIGHHQAMYRFVPGKADRAMIVCVPGNSHLARIFYGHPGGRVEDFLAHWVSQAGHPFLAVSYPLAHPVYSEPAPGFTISDWGDQVAAIIVHVTKTHGLSAPVIAAGWSMGAKIASSLGRAARAHDTEIAMFAALAGDPPIPGTVPARGVASLALGRDGYADRRSLYDWFLGSIADQGASIGHTIIPKDTYLADFLGPIPVNLILSGQVYRNGALVPDLAQAIEDAGSFDFNNYPFPVCLHGTSATDFHNVLFNPSAWSFIRSRLLADRLLGAREPSELSEGEWAALQVQLKLSETDFTERVEGNHAFFVGQPGARQTVEKILSLYDRVRRLPRAPVPTPRTAR
ncbi:MAG: hypothetical protein AAGH83_04625 [Pseudomonadota bacterium]